MTRGKPNRGAAASVSRSRLAGRARFGLGLILSVLLVHTVGAVAPRAAVAWSEPCNSTWANKFLGNGRAGTAIIGVYSEIQYINKGLCVQAFGSPVHSWSLSWVSLDGRPAAVGLNIFQGGYAKCPPSSVGSCPYNNGASYTWVYYAHEQGACGLAFNTGFVKIANATSGTHFFQISKVGSQYNYYIDEQLKYHRSVSDISTCWSGVTGAEWQNEMLNNGDQGGGPPSDHQEFGANQYQNGSGWHPANRTLGDYCDANSYPTDWHCRTSTVDANLFRSWDDRAP